LFDRVKRERERERERERNMAPPKAADGEQKGGKSKGLKKPGRPPKAEKKPVVEGSSKGPGKKGKKAKRNIETYKIYIYKVLKQVSF
jgi:histone H2B